MRSFDNYKKKTENMPGQSKMEDPAGSSHFLLQSMRVPSRSACSASLSKLIGLAKSNSVTTSSVPSLLQYYSEGRRVEDTEISLEYELKDAVEVWGFCFHCCFKCLTDI